MMDIQVFHKYNNLADDGYVKQLTCQHCEAVLVTRVDKDDHPYLQCVFCNISVHPGVEMYARIHAVVKEHYV